MALEVAMRGIYSSEKSNLLGNITLLLLKKKVKMLYKYRGWFLFLLHMLLEIKIPLSAGGTLKTLH